MEPPVPLVGHVGAQPQRPRQRLDRRANGRAALNDEITVIDRRLATLRPTRRMPVSTLNDATPVDRPDTGRP